MKLEHDCKTYYENGHRISGVYSTNRNGENKLVYCEMTYPAGGKRQQHVRVRAKGVFWSN